VPYLFEKICKKTRASRTYGILFRAKSPMQRPIILYLATIDDYCAEEDTDFNEEVRLTYLHELGHHLAGMR